MKTQDADPLVNYLQDANLYGEESSQMNPPEILRSSSLNQPVPKYAQTAMDQHATQQLSNKDIL